MTIRWRYVLALGVIALLTIGSQYFIRTIIDKQESDAQVINIAGRQRMLSQRITKAASQLLLHPNEANRANSKDELRESLEVWLSVHHDLKYGNDTLLVAHLNSPVVQSRFAQLDSSLQIIHQNAIVLLEADGIEAYNALLRISEQEAYFLSGMDRIVNEYELGATRRVSFLKKVELIIGLVTLLVLLIEVFLVFRPAERRIKSYFKEVNDKNALLDAQNQVLERALREAANAAKVKTTFLSTMSHEIRTPMNGVIGMTSLLRDTKLNDEQLELVKVINESGEHLLMLVNDILDFSKIESGKIELDFHPFALRSFIQSVVTPFESQIDKRKVTLRTHIQQEVPDQLFGDSGRLRQILLNLVGNAKKFTFAGEIAISVLLKNYFPQDEANDSICLQFSVSDTGIGIPQHRHTALFEHFTQGDSSITRKYGGTGLGLAICKHLTELMGGEIWIESSPGEGSVFSFTVELEVLMDEVAAITSHMAHS